MARRGRRRLAARMHDRPRAMSRAPGSCTPREPRARHLAAIHGSFLTGNRKLHVPPHRYTNISAGAWQALHQLLPAAGNHASQGSMHTSCVARRTPHRADGWPVGCRGRPSPSRLAPPPPRQRTGKKVGGIPFGRSELQRELDVVVDQQRSEEQRQVDKRKAECLARETIRIV